MLPATKWATRSPMVVSGNTTWWAPTRSRICPCLWVIALAQMSCTPASARASTVSTLASMSAPMATTACSKSATPSWCRACSSVESACATWVSSSDHLSTSSGLSSTAITSRFNRTSEDATETPNRPKPITSTGVASFLLFFLANDGSLLGQTVVTMAGLERQRRGYGDRAYSSNEHQRHQDQLCRCRKVRGDARRKPDGRESRDRLEEDHIEGVVSGHQDRHRADGDQSDSHQRDGERLTLSGAADPSVRDRRVRLPAHLRPDHECEQEEGGDLDAARRTRTAAADEHEHVVDRHRLRCYLPVVDAVEARGSRNHPPGDARDGLAPRGQ